MPFKYDFFRILFMCLLSTLTLDYKIVGGSATDMGDYLNEHEEDLSRITWAHAVNSKQLLDAVLQRKDVMMIEADVVLGYLKGDTRSKTLPVMAHPPQTSSDLSLEEFLHTVASNNMGKGVKLDFKTKEAFQAAEPVLENFFLKQDATFSFWLNADIIQGPVNCKTKPVDADYFLSTCVTKFPQAVLSVGWTTCYGNGIDKGSYLPSHINNMTNALNKNAVVQPVTFPVRAGLAAQSHDSLTNLIGSSVPGTTLTIYSSNPSDPVDIDALRRLVSELGPEKVYLDMPKDMTDRVLAGSAATARVVLPLAIAALALLYVM